MNTRELAIVVWMIILFFVGMLKKHVRDQILNLGKSIFGLIKLASFKIILAYQFMVFLGLYFIVHHFNLSYWIFKDYILVFLTTVLTFLGSYKKIKFRAAILRSLGVGAIFKFLVDSYTFSFKVELVLVPVFVILVLMSVQAENEHQEAASKLIQYILGFFLILIVFHIINEVVKNWWSLENLFYWEGYYIEAVSWIVNLPLILFSIPLFEYDLIDNYFCKKKTGTTLFFQSSWFWLERVIYGHRIFSNARKHVVNVYQGGLINKRLVITLRANTTDKQAKRVEKLYRLMLGKESDYNDGKRILPISIECRDAIDRHLVIPMYEIHGLEEKYKLSQLNF
ncbi:hypothetical protein [Liquorilactobacillus satsumensis]|uniref:hypothetical protein n=1 Tax=Liquorilactobacillus satsumensis TaxID=259059 RepID=UPI0039EA97F8